jgi:AcrR family transcriptional regulator
VDAALDLFERDGFDATSVEQIAERADVARRTFFHYFPGKEAVLFGDLTLKGDLMLSELAHRPDGEPPLAALLGAVRVMLGDGFDRDRAQRIAAIVDENPSLLQRSRTLVRNRFESDVVAALRVRYPDRDELELRSLNAMVFGAVQAGIGMLLAEAKRPLRDYFDDAIDAMIAASKSLPS